MKTKKVTFTAKIVAEVFNTPAVAKGGISITSVVAKMARGDFKVELPQFIDEPTIILIEQ